MLLTDIAERCLILRRRMGLSQPELAVRMGVCPKSVWKLENERVVVAKTYRKFEVFEARNSKVGGR